MKIIISPAKKMQVQNDGMTWREKPVFLEDAGNLHRILKGFSRSELQYLFQANEKITEENYNRYQSMNLDQGLTAAVLSYVGIQYQYMAPHIFTDSQWNYVCRHLRILSGFYGILKADDGIVPYRLEMQAKLSTENFKDLYDFWGERLYRQLVSSDHQILNLASKEYSKAIEPWLTSDDEFITCVFGCLTDGRVKVKATEAKMARGEMVRWLAENQIEKIEQVRAFDCLDFSFDEKRSTADELVFLKKTGR